MLGSILQCDQRTPPWVTREVVFLVCDRVHGLSYWDFGVGRSDGAATPFFRNHRCRIRARCMFEEKDSFSFVVAR